MTEESLLTVTATTGEILRYAQNDKGMFSFRFLLRQTPICFIIIHFSFDILSVHH